MRLSFNDPQSGEESSLTPKNSFFNFVSRTHMRHHAMSIQLKPSVVLLHLLLLLGSHWIACLELVAFDDSLDSNTNSRDNLPQDSHFVAPHLRKDIDNSIHQGPSVVEERVDPLTAAIAVLAKETHPVRSALKGYYKSSQEAIQRVRMHRNHISNFEQAQSAYKLIQDWNGVPVSKFAEFDKAVMGGFKKAGMNEAEASEVVVKVLTEEIGNLGAARLLNDLQKGNPELFARTQSSLYQYWNKIPLSYSSFHDGKISMGMSESPYHIQDVILDTFSEYFKYAKQVPGSEDDSAYKSMMKDLESKGYGGFVDNIIRTFSPPSEFKPANDATRIALEYLKKQHVKYNTPSAIIKAVPFEEKSLNVLGNPFYRLSALCKSKVEVEVGAVDEVKKQAKWLIKELDDWVFDKKFFLIMYPLREKEELAASVLEQLSFRWKKDEALSKALESDLKKSIPQIPAGKLRWSMTEPDAPLNYFRDLAFEKPILASK